MSEWVRVKEEPREAEGTLWPALGAPDGLKKELGLGDGVYAEHVDFALPDPEAAISTELLETKLATLFRDTTCDPEDTAGESSLHKPIITKPCLIKLERISQVKTYECPICHKHIKRELKRHILTHTQEEIDTIKIAKKTGKGKFKCHICGARLAHPFSLKKHLKIHARIARDPFKQQLYSKVPKRKYVKDKFECDVCGKQTTRKESLVRHLTRHGDELVACGHCNEPFKYTWELVDHIKLGVCKENIRVTPNVKIPEVMLKQCFVRLNRLSYTNESKAFECIDIIPEVSENDLSEDIVLGETALETDGETYYCGVCEEQFETLSSLGGHVCRRPKKPVSCDICKKKFRFQTLLVAHARLHTGEKPYICDVCKKQFRLKNSMRMHIRTMHLGEDPFSCKVCKEKFRSTKTLGKHVREHTGEEEKKLYSCKVCKKRFKFERECVEHGRVHTGEKPFRCTFCNMSFRVEVALRIHSRVHTGEKPYTCDVCKRSFRIWQTLDAHKRVHTGEKPFPCDVCNKQFRRYDTLYTHKRTHTGEKPYACEFCPKRFTQRAHLKTHQRTHTGEKPFHCNVCNKSFSERHKLTVHGRSHSEDRPCACVCGKAFKSTQALNTHWKTHTGDKPYACEVCNKAFLRKAHLKDHMRSHTKEWPFECEVCRRRFQRPDYLRLHRKLHRAETG
ncbi:hypothetical protein MSG28_015274 [Choristoneura fumiferana]|uniref:Uncharacterized protein n=1 Tax=Choristoneura fumiferana TaxID=7141 RepID=A0ACC0K9S4_CHOFU|nr:hypothetical protein MSG28_015274 [Choristoneura fumiferana]